MRKTSQDGGDNTSITSGYENDAKKSGTGIIKTKRNSIKKKIQNMSNESDEAIIQPLLQKDKVNMDVGNQSAKFMLSKAKTDSMSEKGNERDKLLAENQMEKPSMTVAPVIKGSSLANGLHDKFHVNTTFSNKTNVPVDTNGVHDDIKGIAARKNQALVDIDEHKKSNYSASPLIFTTAKIHSDGSSKNMEPVQMNPLPILSTTIDSSVVKTGIVTEPDTKMMESFKNDHSKSKVKDQISPRISGIHTSPYTENLDKDISVKDTYADKKHDSDSNKISLNKTENDSTRSFTSHDAIITDDKLRQKDKISTKIVSSTANTTKVMVANKDLKSSPVSSKDATDSIKLSRDTTKTPVSTINSESKRDINKNIQSEASVQKPETSNVIKSPITTTATSSAVNKDIISKSSFSNKQIERQKTTTEDTSKDKDKRLTSRSNSQTQPISSELGLQDIASSEIYDDSSTVNAATKNMKNTAAKSNQSITIKSNDSNLASIVVKTPLSTPLASIPIAKTTKSSTKLSDTTTLSKSTKVPIAPLSTSPPSAIVSLSASVKTSPAETTTKSDSIQPLVTSSVKESNNVTKLDSVNPSVTSSIKTVTNIPTVSKPISTGKIISTTTGDNATSVIKPQPTTSTKSIASPTTATIAIKSTDTVKASMATTTPQPTKGVVSLTSSSVKTASNSTSHSEITTKSKTSLNAKGTGSAMSSIPVAKTTTSVTASSTGKNISKPSTGTTVKPSSSSVKSAQSAKYGTSNSVTKSTEPKKSDPKTHENKDTKGLKNV